MGHAKVLLDPCGSDLAYPSYGGQRGFVQRFTAWLTVGTTTATDSGFILWSPGSGLALCTQDLATSATTSAAIAYSASSAPGFTYLNSNASGMRCVSACIQAYTKASEQARAGFVYTGVVPTNALFSGSTTTVDSILSLTQFANRTPADKVEVKFIPTGLDKEYGGIGQSITNPNEQNLMVFAWSGQPPAVGFRVRLTAVVEWLPKAGLGVESTSHLVDSPSEIEQVRQFLNDLNPSWWTNLGSAKDQVVQNLIKGATAAASAAAYQVGANVVRRQFGPLAV